MSGQIFELNVPDMSCGHCVSAVTNAIKAQDFDAIVTVSLADKTVRVETTVEREEITHCLAEAGYPAS
ncbi:cation transporter [Uliginosibacterium sp. H3]|uniref:Cation transporter n=1 Tax=Uliginosibacterium silvisoli TaxID=3114758 RepID=A0ABU6JY46_9RHOO|nr:cation transporter [Uliginosibacterium sp. H3]